MCLGIPGRLIQRNGGEPAFGRVAFSGVERDVCLAYTPEAVPGDYVIVHAGFAISVVDAAEAEATLAALAELEPGSPSGVFSVVP